jgi:mRNA interferase RelE/StbE
MFRAEFSHYAEKQFSKLPTAIQERALNVIERIKFNPYHFIKRKEGASCFIMRIGEYRAVLDIDDSKKIIYIIEIGHRKNIYD